MKTIATCVSVLCLVAAPIPATAQQLEVRFAPVSQQPSGATAFLIEAAGGVAGSAIGFTLAAAVFDECEAEDLVCNLGSAAAAIGVATATSAVGAYLAGRLGDTRPSLTGGVIGSLAGAAAGIAAWHLAREELDLVRSDAAGTAVYAFTQGLLTAAGSRLMRALRD